MCNSFFSLCMRNWKFGKWKGWNACSTRSVAETWHSAVGVILQVIFYCACYHGNQRDWTVRKRSVFRDKYKTYLICKHEDFKQSHNNHMTLTWMWSALCRWGGAGRRSGPVSRLGYSCPFHPTRSETAETAAERPTSLTTSVSTAVLMRNDPITMSWCLWWRITPQTWSESHIWTGAHLYLNAAVAEEQAGVSGCGHLQTRGLAPHLGLPYKKSEGTGLAVLVTLAKYVWKSKQHADDAIF